MNDEELLNKLYYRDLVVGGVNNLYKVAKQAHPKITAKIVKEWLDKQQSVQLNNKPIIKHDFKPIYSELPYAFQFDLTLFQDIRNKIKATMYFLLLLILIQGLVMYFMVKIKNQKQL